MAHTYLSDGWEVSETYLRKELKFQDFPKAISFMQEMVPHCEKMDHHPEFKNTYDTLQITLSTHSAGNRVTEKDIALAKIIDELYERSYMISPE